MYSLLPALVSGLFLGYGLYVLAAKGRNRVSLCFFALCLSTFCWQAAWAVLFQVRDPFWADVWARLGYLLIIFLPTNLYHFLVEIAETPRERRWVALSYGLAFGLGLVNVGTELFVAGHYDYFFGPYPKAGPLHPVHLLQTALVVSRGLVLTWQSARRASSDQRARLELCVASLLIYFFAAVDYLCNYGVEFYPPGVFFIAISLGLIAVAVTRYQLMHPVVMAASVAHEMRTPLANIRLQAEALRQWLPELHRGYALAREEGLVAPSLSAPDFSRLAALASGITHQVDRSNVVIDLMLASARMERIKRGVFSRCSMADCVRQAVESYPFRGKERGKLCVSMDEGDDFEFFGSEALMVSVLLNLFKNAFYAMQEVGKGELAVSISRRFNQPLLTVRDTGPGIGPEVLPRIFDAFYSTKRNDGAGLGLAFCRRAIESFGARLDCESVEGEFTAFHMRFPALAPSAQFTCRSALSSSS